MPITLVLVDDHKVIRDSIQAILGSQPEYRIIGEAEAGPDAVSLCQKLRPDLVLTDIGLPGMSGLEVTIELARSCPKSKVVILSMYDDANTVMTAVRNGTRGFVLKSASAAELVEALRAVAGGGSYFSPRVADHLIGAVHGEREPCSPAVLKGLSPRKFQVLRLVAAGKTNKEIAVLLCLEFSTVRTYRKQLMRLLGVNNAAGLTRWVIAAGISGVGAPGRRDLARTAQSENHAPVSTAQTIDVDGRD